MDNKRSWYLRLKINVEEKNHSWYQRKCNRKIDSLLSPVMYNYFSSLVYMYILSTVLKLSNSWTDKLFIYKEQNLINDHTDSKNWPEKTEFNYSDTELSLSLIDVVLRPIYMVLIQKSNAYNTFKRWARVKLVTSPLSIWEKHLL